MKDNELLFDRKSHVLYSKPCKKEIRAKIALHYPEAERETIWEQVQRQYADFLSDWRTDLGGKRNFHNGVGASFSFCVSAHRESPPAPDTSSARRPCRWSCRR